MVQICYIYYCEKGILVVASHVQADGMTPNGSPATLLPRNASAEQIGEAVLRSLHGGRHDLTEEEGRAELRYVLTLSGERTWRSLEKNWQMIHLWLEDSEASLHIAPMRRYQTGGYVSKQGDLEYSAPLEPLAIGTTIIRIISEPPLKPMRHIPSHT